MKFRSGKKITSVILSLVMIVTMLPMGGIVALSAESETIKGAPETIEIQTKTDSGRESNINDNWKFNMTTADCSAGTYNDSAWSTVQLPHDFSIYQNFTTSGEAESGFLPGGTGWYRKKLVIPAAQNGKRFELNFDAAYMHTYVYVNGSYVGENHYGYNSFAFDITDKLTCDGSTENIIAVKVVHNTPSSRWYSGSGIYRDVTLITTDKVHVAHNGLTITTPNISSGNGTVNVKANIKNDSSSSTNVSVKASIYEKGSETAVATATNTGTVNANSSSNITITPVVSSPKLWSLDNPNLYIAKIEVSVDGSVVDTYEDQFGFRYFDWSRTNGFSLNGTRVQLQGVCMHHDQGALGSAAYHDAMYRQMAKMKDMGVNAIRATHNPYSKEFYKICDELGLLVIEELFDGWAWAKNGNSNDFSSQWNVNLTAGNTIIGGSTSMTWPEFVTKEVCQRDVNRPSVFMWSICNELFEGANGGVSIAETYAQNIIDWIKTVDTTRKYTAGDNNIKNGNSYYIAVDRVIANNGGIVGLNYCNSSQYSSIYNNYSSWMFYGAETASTTNTRAMYKGLSSNSAADSNRHITSYDESAVGWGKTANDSMYTTLANTFLAGEFRWTGWDYIGEPTPWNGTGTGQVSGGNGATPNSSYFGIVDTAGFEKDTYYLYRSQWNRNSNAHTTHLVTAWDSDNYCVSNGKTPVIIYSNAAKVELYLRKNGSSTDTLMGTATRKDSQTSVGAKYHQYNTTSNNTSECTATALNNSSGTSLYARFDVTYTDGTLFTKSYDSNGNLISTDKIEGRHSVTTAGNVSKAKITSNKTVINADGESLAYFTVDLLDSNNNLVTTGQNQIKFDITGNGEIMGVDNGDEATTQKFQQPSVIDINNRTTAKIYAWGGKALVIVRSTKNAGDFTITASSPSSEFASVSASVKAVSTGDVSLEDGDINSYTLVRNYTVKKGTEPTFDTKATATVVGSDTIKNGTVAWNPVDSSVYNEVGDHQITGIVEFDSNSNSYPVTGTLHVVDTVSIMKNVSAVTMTNTVPTLPGTVKGLLSTGEESGEFEVTWDEMNSSMFAVNDSIVEVSGTADAFGDSIPVKAFVRVVKPNVTTTYDITDTAYITSDVQSGLINSLRDGNITTKAWTNENNSTTSDEAYVQFRWDTAVSLSGFDITYNISGSSMAPEDVDIQVSYDDQTFESVGYTGPIEKIKGNTTYKYTLDDTANPVSVRVIFTQQGRTTGDCCVSLNELKAFSDNKSPVTANSTAVLSDISINGATISGFSESKKSYSSIEITESDVITATSKDNAAVTVVKNATNAVILVMSEDGETSEVYTLGKVVIPSTPDVTNEVYKFDFKNSTPTSLETGSSLKTLTDNAGHTLNYMLWQASSVTTGQYMKIQDAFINTPSTIDTGIKGDCWNVVYRYNKTTSDKPNATLIGLGTTGGSGSMADLIYITADGYIETGFTNTSSNQSTSVGKSLYNTSASSPEVLDIGYDNGKVTVKYNDEIVFTKDISSNDTLNNKFKNGVGSFFIGANKYVNAGGTYSDTSHNSSGQAAYIQKLYDLTGSVTVKGTAGNVTEVENIAPKATVTSNVAESLTPLTDGDKAYSASNRVINWNVRSQGQMTVTFTWDKLYDLDYTNIYFYSEGWGTFPPKQLDIYASTDGTTFGSSPIMSYTNDGTNIPSVSSSAGVYEKKYSFPSNTKAKAIKIVATVRDGSISSGKFATGFAEIEVFNKAEILTPDPEPVDPDPEIPSEFVADTTDVDAAMRAFESKVASGKIYKNVYNAYSAYVECQKARDTAKYGHDDSVDLTAKAQALTTATNAMSEWTMSMPTDVSKVSAKFSSYDNATSNKQYFKSALYITQSDDPVVVNNNPGHAWFGVYYHNGTYIYDGTNAIEVPVMLMTIPYKNPFYFFSAYLSGQNSAVSLKGRWFGSDGPGSGQARKYYYYHDEASLQSMSSDYYSRRFSFPSTSSYNNNSTYNDSKIGDLSGKSNWNLATTNTFVINGATLFPSGSKTVSTDVSMGTINMHTYNSTSLSSPWINSYTLGTQIKVINQKGLKDRVTTYTEKFKNVANYSEGGLNWAADGINRFANLDYNITAQAAGTLTEEMTTAHNSFNSADSSSPTNSTAYATLRAALDDSTIITNDNCYSDGAFNEYIASRNNAIKAMKAVATNGYVGSNISSLADALNDALDALKKSSGSHKYSAGIYNPATKKITYTCETNGEHTAIIDATAYAAAVDAINAELANPKYKSQAIKNAMANVAECVSIINNNPVNKVYTQGELDALVAKIDTTVTDLDIRTNIKRFDINYSYQKNGRELNSGLVIDSRYGDWLVDNEYELEGEDVVYKWTTEYTVGDNSVVRQIDNKSTNLNYYVDKDAILTCYITDNKEEAPDGQHKVVFKNRIGKITGVLYVDDGTQLAVDANDVKLNGNVVHTATNIPYYQITGFKSGATTYSTGDSIAVTKDMTITPAFSVGGDIKIWTTGSTAGNATINDETGHSGDISNAYLAKWDEPITLHYNSNGSRDVFWYNNGRLVGYGEFYKFRATCDSEISAEITDATAKIPRAYIDYFDYEVENNRARAVTTFYCPNGMTATKAGVVLSTKTSDKQEIIETGREFASSTFTDGKNQVMISVSRTATTAFTMYAVPFVEINGTTYYGDVATLSYPK